MQLLPDVVHSVPLTSSILMEGTSKTQDQVLIHVAYVKENDEILLLGLPGAIISEFSTKNIVQEVSRLILLKYGSLAKAALGSTTELDNLIGLIGKKACLLNIIKYNIISRNFCCKFNE